MDPVIQFSAVATTSYEGEIIKIPAIVAAYGPAVFFIINFG